MAKAVDKSSSASDGPFRPGAATSVGASSPLPKPQVIKGLVVSQGIAIGRVVLLGDDIRRIPKREIVPAAVEIETIRLDHAIKASVRELKQVYEHARAEMGDEAAKIFLVHMGLLSDKYLIKPMKEMIERDLVNAEYAVATVLAAQAARFRAASDSAFTTKVNDIDDLAQRLLGQLMGRAEGKLAKLEPGTILLGSDFTPSQAAAFDRTKIIGFATDLGGRTSHTAIVARALNLPAVVGCRNITQVCRDGQTVILDGDRGLIVVNPDKDRLDEYRGYIEQRRVFQLSLRDLKDLPSVTLDGQHVQVLGNIEFPEEAQSVLDVGGEGVGLYRTEFLYLTSKSEPSEEDHYKAYRRCLELMDGKPLTIRTVDLGADKYTQERAEQPERNPFLGLRSIRYCLKNQPMFKRQLRALLRASAFGSIKIMFPLVMSPSEFRHGKYLINDVMEDLDEEGIAFDRDIKVGMMVEVPSAALMAEIFAREVDFFSIGTNDLVQYTLAVDRTNEAVAHLYNPAHPAVVRLIRDILRAARHHDTPVSCCGESASDLEYSLLLMGLGLRTLSVTSSAIPTLKRLIRSVKMAHCERIAKEAIAFDSEAQLSAYLRDRARKILPEAFDGRSAD